MKPSEVVIDQPYVTLSGFGPQATVIRRAGSGDVITVSANNVTITDLKVIASTINDKEGAIRYGSGMAAEILVDNVWLEQQGPGSLIATPNIDTTYTWVVRDLIGITNAAAYAAGTRC